MFLMFNDNDSLRQLQPNPKQIFHSQLNPTEASRAEETFNAKSFQF